MNNNQQISCHEDKKCRQHIEKLILYLTWAILGVQNANFPSLSLQRPRFCRYLDPKNIQQKNILLDEGPKKNVSPANYSDELMGQIHWTKHVVNWKWSTIFDCFHWNVMWKQKNMNPDGIHRKTSKLSFHLSLLTQFLVGSAKTNMLIPQQK